MAARLLRMLRQRLRSLFRRRAVEDELERELSLHLEQLTREGIAAGLSEAEARRAARLAFGSPDAASEECRDARRVGLIQDAVQDVRYALRLLRRSPGFFATAVASLALGIGANAAIFSVVDAVLLRLLSVERPHELAFLQVTGSERSGGAPPYPCFERIRERADALAGIAAFANDEQRLEVDGRVEQVYGQVASGNYFDLLGVRPAAGRLLRAEDERLDPPVAVIGHSYWRRRFGGDVSVLGRTLTSGGRVYTIVGVTPPEFWGLVPGRQVELTLPITSAGAALANAETWWFDAVARVRPEAAAQATAQADAVFQAFLGERTISQESRRKFFDHLELRPAGRGRDRLRARFSRPLQLLWLVAALVLLIACANLGNLLLARGTARARELAIRQAAGAGAGRLLRQMLTETLVLFAIGAGAGLGLAFFASRGLLGFFAIGRSPILLDARFDWRLAAFAALLALLAGLATGLWPALRALRRDPQAALKDGEGRLPGSRGSGSAARLLVAGQVALSLVLLVAAGMFTRTMAHLRAVDAGFRGEGVITMSLDPILRGEGAAEARERFWRGALERVRGLPGVRAASLSVLTPLSGRDVGKLVSVPGFQASSEEELRVRVNHVSEGYFETFGVGQVAGRTLRGSDDAGAPRVAVINETAARAYFGGASPLGAVLGFGQGRDYTVVGVVRDHKHRRLQEPVPRFVFVPLWQRLDPVARISLAVASDQPTPALARAVSAEAVALQPSTLVSDVLGLREQIDATLIGERLLSVLASAFAALALLLAAIGLYGVLSYAVASRRGEFGVRLALGAPPARVAADVVRGVLLQVAAGVALGLPAAFAVARAAAGLLFGVTPADPASYLFGCALLALVGGLAAWLPARRACSVDPSEALRRG